MNALLHVFRKAVRRRKNYESRTKFCKVLRQSCDNSSCFFDSPCRWHKDAASA